MLDAQLKWEAKKAHVETARSRDFSAVLTRSRTVSLAAGMQAQSGRAVARAGCSATYRSKESTTGRAQ